MKISIDNKKRQGIDNCHDGKGSIKFREVFADHDFESNLAHFHETVINPHSSIGYHEHIGNEEVYYIVEGKGLMQLNGDEFNLGPGDAIVAQSGDSHGLKNDTDNPLRILVFECKY